MSFLPLNTPRLAKSFQHAIRGLSAAWRAEPNVRIHVLAAVAVVVAAIVLEFSALPLAILILTITLVLALELVNTFFETLIDLLNPRLHHQVAFLKDTLAAAVLVAALGAVVIGILLFGPYLW